MYEDLMSTLQFKWQPGHWTCLETETLLYSVHIHFRANIRTCHAQFQNSGCPLGMKSAAQENYSRLPPPACHQLAGATSRPLQSPWLSSLPLPTPAAAAWAADLAVSESKFAQAIYPSHSRAPRTENTDIHLNYKSPSFIRKKNPEFGFHAGEGLINPDIPERLQPKLHSGCGKYLHH